MLAISQVSPCIQSFFQWVGFGSSSDMILDERREMLTNCSTDRWLRIYVNLRLGLPSKLLVTFCQLNFSRPQTRNNISPFLCDCGSLNTSFFVGKNKKHNNLSWNKSLSFLQTTTSHDCRRKLLEIFVLAYKKTNQLPSKETEVRNECHI